MGSDKNIKKQKEPRKSGGPRPSSSDIQKEKLRPRRKVGETSVSSKKKSGPVIKNNSISPLFGEKYEKVDPSFELSPLNLIKHRSLGELSMRNMRKYAVTYIVNDFSRHKTHTSLSPFERRVTSIAWHHKYSQIVAAGSKGGELVLYNLDKPGSNFIPGIGPGGSIVSMKFHRDDPSLVYTASITGDVRVDDFFGSKGKILASSGCFEHWFSSLDVCYDRNLLIAGSTTGNVALLTVQGQKNWNKRLHKKKVTHVEFCAADPNIFVTASIDHSVKLWDLRMMSGSELKPNPIREFSHEKGVNSAYFSPSNRHSLLTTDQHSEIRVYGSPMWDEEFIITHPHRQFQHITPIKATWHPIEDVIVVGRYPDAAREECAQRCIDFFDGSTGNLVYKLRSPNGGIVSLNHFNVTGDCLACGTGTYLIFWKDEKVFDGVPIRKSLLDGLRLF